MQYPMDAHRAPGADAAHRGRNLMTTDQITPDQPDEWFMQLVSCPIPETDIEVAKQRLYDECRVEVPFVNWKGLKIVRVSFQAYNDESDLDRLIDGLEMVLRPS